MSKKAAKRKRQLRKPREFSPGDLRRIERQYGTP
jgi:ribosomal protein L35